MEKTPINPTRIINIVGVDGAGKTTLARNLAANIRRTDKRIRYRYCQYFAKLLYPFKLLAKVSVMRRTDEFQDYSSYNTAKKNTSRRYPLLAAIYTSVWFVDYLIQVFFKITIPILLGQRLIIDRYIFDIAVNLSLTNGRDVKFAATLVRLFFRFAARPDRVLFIDLPEEVAYERKGDIPDIEYLKERRVRYLWLAKEFGFDIIDGNRPPEQVLQTVIACLTRNHSVKTEAGDCIHYFPAMDDNGNASHEAN